MKKTTLLLLPLVLVMLEASAQVLAQAQTQAQPELDITITVLEEGESPAGFIQQLALPPAEFFNDELTDTTAVDIEANDIGAEVATGAATDISELTGVATETVNNTISETISIDGTAAAVAEPGLVPPAIVNVLDEDLPLVNSLDDVLKETTGGVVNGELPVDGELPTNVDIVLPLEDDAVVDIVDNLGVATDSVLPEINDVTGDLLNTETPLETDVLPDTNLLPAETTPDPEALLAPASDAVDAVDDLVGETPEPPVADTLEEVTRGLPDLLR